MSPGALPFSSVEALIVISFILSACSTEKKIAIFSFTGRCAELCILFLVFLGNEQGLST